MTATAAGAAKTEVAATGRASGGVRDDWNAGVLAAGGHLLQSWEWGEFKSRHGWEAERVQVDRPDGSAMAQILFRRRGPLSLAYVPRGPVLHTNSDRRKLFLDLRSEIDRACRRRRSLSLVVETDGALDLPGTYRTVGFVQGPEHFQPGRTVKVPLLDDDALLDQMHQKTRYSVRLAQRRGVELRRGGADSESADAFYDLLRETSERNQFGIHSRSYYDDFMQIFGERAVMLFAVIEGRTVAGLIAARFGDEAVYMYGGSSTEHRGHGAAFLIQFEAMRWAREHGCLRYDLWGIPMHDPVVGSSDEGRVAGSQGDDWRGLYNFKVRFGGEIVSYPPSMERRYVPVLSWLARRFTLDRT